MSDPYRLAGPALISFSGGRTSGMMLHHVLDAWDDKLPDLASLSRSKTKPTRNVA
jgi:hypothetical protein